MPFISPRAAAADPARRPFLATPRVPRRAPPAPQTSSIGLFVKAGSRYDSLPGLSCALQRIAFASTQHRSAIKLARDVEDAGGSVSAKAGREVVSGPRSEPVLVVAPLRLQMSRDHHERRDRRCRSL
jgi:hypothetical protein